MKGDTMFASASEPVSPTVAWSRRGAVGACLATLGLAATRFLDVAAAQADATPGVAALPAVVQAWVEAYNGRDFAAMAALYAADGVYEDVPNNFAARGDEIPNFLATAEQGFGDVRVDVTGGFGTDTWAAVEYLFSATNLGMIPIPGTEGMAFTSRAVTIFELSADKIRRSSDYYDLVSILTQLGVMPAGDAAGAMPQGTPAT